MKPLYKLNLINWIPYGHVNWQMCIMQNYGINGKNMQKNGINACSDWRLDTDSQLWIAIPKPQLRVMPWKYYIKIGILMWFQSNKWKTLQQRPHVLSQYLPFKFNGTASIVIAPKFGFFICRRVQLIMNLKNESFFIYFFFLKSPHNVYADNLGRKV